MVFLQNQSGNCFINFKNRTNSVSEWALDKKSAIHPEAIEFVEWDWALAHPNEMMKFKKNIKPSPQRDITESTQPSREQMAFYMEQKTPGFIQVRTVVGTTTQHPSGNL
jgi:hypothetical protein